MLASKETMAMMPTKGRIAFALTCATGMKPNLARIVAAFCGSGFCYVFAPERTAYLATEERRCLAHRDLAGVLVMGIDLAGCSLADEYVDVSTCFCGADGDIVVLDRRVVVFLSYVRSSVARYTNTSTPIMT